MWGPELVLLRIEEFSASMQMFIEHWHALNIDG
jgi:hypothetical protein